jgi:hypothetical protein
MFVENFDFGSKGQYYEPRNVDSAHHLEDVQMSL